MVSKKILGVAIAAALAAPAFAGDFALTSADSIKVAKSSLADGSKVNIASPAGNTQAAPGDYYAVTDSATLTLDLTGTVGIGLAADQKIYVRVELTNAAFKTGVAVGDLDMDDSGGAMAVIQADTVSQGGAAKDRFAVFTVSPTAGDKFEVGSNFRLSLADLLVAGTGDVGAKVTFYSTIDNAVNATSALNTVTNKNAIVKFVDGVKVTYNPATPTAEADSLFKKFQSVAYGTKTEVGNFVVAVDGVVSAADGTTLSLDEAFAIAADKSMVTVTGDFSNADYSLHAAGDCTTGVTKQINLFVNNDATATSNNNKTTNKANAEYKTDIAGVGVAAADTTQTVYLCVAKQDNGLVLPASEFKVGIAYDKTAANVWAVPAQAATLVGTVKRNAATVQVPYLSTAAGLNQKLILVNRGSADVSYSIAFTSEASTTAAAGAKATGTLVAGKTTVLKATDVVTLTGGTRTAATVTVVGSYKNIDAATQTVVNDPASVSFGSNDTVNLTVQ